MDRLTLSSGTGRSEELDGVRVKPIMARQAWVTIRSERAVRNQTTVHTFGRDEIVEDETRAVVGNLEDWPGRFYKRKGERHQSEMMAALMGAYGVRRLVIRN